MSKYEEKKASTHKESRIKRLLVPFKADFVQEKVLSSQTRILKH